MKTHIAEMLPNDYYTVEVTFDSSHPAAPSANKLYTYKVPNTLPLQRGDKLVVLVAHHIRNGEQLQVVTVREVHNAASIDYGVSYKYKWVVGLYATIIAPYQQLATSDREVEEAFGIIERAIERRSFQDRAKEAMAAMTDVEREKIGRLLGRMENRLAEPLKHTEFKGGMADDVS